MAETPNSGGSTPNDSRFTSQAVTVEDRLKADTVGLVTLDDFRKRRAEALEAADAGEWCDESRWTVRTSIMYTEVGTDGPSTVSQEQKRHARSARKSQRQAACPLATTRTM